MLARILPLPLSPPPFRLPSVPPFILFLYSTLTQSQFLSPCPQLPPQSPQSRPRSSDHPLPTGRLIGVFQSLASATSSGLFRSFPARRGESLVVREETTSLRSEDRALAATESVKPDSCFDTSRIHLDRCGLSGLYRYRRESLHLQVRLPVLSMLSESRDHLGSHCFGSDRKSLPVAFAGVRTLITVCPGTRRPLTSEAAHPRGDSEYGAPAALLEGRGPPLVVGPAPEQPRSSLLESFKLAVASPANGSLPSRVPP